MAIEAIACVEKPASAGFYRERRLNRPKSDRSDQSKNIDTIGAIVKPRRYFWSDHNLPTPGSPGSDQNCRLRPSYSLRSHRQFCSEPLTSTQLQKFEAPDASPPLRACRNRQLIEPPTPGKPTAAAGLTSSDTVRHRKNSSASWPSKRLPAAKSPQVRAFIGRVVSIDASRIEVIRAKISMPSGQ